MKSWRGLRKWAFTIQFFPVFRAFQKALCLMSTNNVYVSDHIHMHFIYSILKHTWNCIIANISSSVHLKSQHLACPFSCFSMAWNGQERKATKQQMMGSSLCKQKIQCIHENQRVYICIYCASINLTFFSFIIKIHKDITTYPG